METAALDLEYLRLCITETCTAEMAEWKHAQFEHADKYARHAAKDAVAMWLKDPMLPMTDGERVPSIGERVGRIISACRSLPIIEERPAPDSVSAPGWAVQRIAYELPHLLGLLAPGVDIDGPIPGLYKTLDDARKGA